MYFNKCICICNGFQQKHIFSGFFSTFFSGFEQSAPLKRCPASNFAYLWRAPLAPTRNPIAGGPRGHAPPHTREPPQRRIGTCGHGGGGSGDGELGGLAARDAAGAGAGAQAAARLVWVLRIPVRLGSIRLSGRGLSRRDRRCGIGLDSEPVSGNPRFDLFRWRFLEGLMYCRGNWKPRIERKLVPFLVVMMHVL